MCCVTTSCLPVRGLLIVSPENSCSSRRTFAFVGDGGPLGASGT
jgi:hypothetical protein